MIRNSGPYGPNDIPINIGAPINMAQINGPVNMAHHLDNLEKIPEQISQTSSTNYNLPAYTSYGHSSYGMTPTMNTFSSYHVPGFPTGFTSQNPNLLHSSSMNHVQNGVLPMNLNVHEENSYFGTNYYAPFENKRLVSDDVKEYKDGSLEHKSSPVNVTENPEKSFQKLTSLSNEEHVNCDHRDEKQEDRREQNKEKLDLSSKPHSKPEIGSERYKNLEKTVKLIENIILNSSSSRTSCSNNTEQNVTKESVGKPESDLIKESDKLESDRISFTDDENFNDDKSESSIENDCVSVDEDISKSDPEYNPESDVDVKPAGITDVLFEKITESVDDTIMVKVEALSSWTDLEYLNPFHRDINSTRREDMTNSNIFDAEKSVYEAKEAITQDCSEDVYFECPYCNTIFKHPKRFLIHTKWHSFGLTNDKRLESIREKELKRHMKKAAREMERNAKEEADEHTEGAKFTCKDCNKVYNAKTTLKNHRSRVHPTSTRECKICQKTVVGWNAMRIHLLTHVDNAAFQCSDCPKRFKYPQSLAKHRDTHKEKTHPCTDCPKMFGSAAQLKMHMKVHERALRGPTFRCSYCGKGFYESYNLQAHERTHRNERPFVCNICNTSFGTNSGLQRHIKVSHNKSKPYVCSTCHRSFVSEAIRDRHELRNHGNPEDFKFVCEHCDCRYLKQKDLKKHNYKAHPKGKRKRKAVSQSDSE